MKGKRRSKAIHDPALKTTFRYKSTKGICLVCGEFDRVIEHPHYNDGNPICFVCVRKIKRQRRKH